MATPVKFTREVRSEIVHIEENTGQGIARRELRQDYIVRASEGAVVLKVRIQLDDLPELHRSRYKASAGWAVSGHFRKRLRDYWAASEPCDVLGHESEGIVCYGDTGYWLAEQTWNLFLSNEELGWKYLEDMYNDWRKPE